MPNNRDTVMMLKWAFWIPFFFFFFGNRSALNLCKLSILLEFVAILRYFYELPKSSTRFGSKEYIQCSGMSWNMFKNVSERVPECPKTVGEYHGTYSGIFWNNYASECSTMSSRMSLKRLGIVWDVPECSGTFSGMS